MAYQVLARKWRPQLFSELVGQEHVATTLLNALKSDRMPHALLFTGPRGVGKTSAARILAKSLRCPNAIDFIPCDKCEECVAIATGRAIDVIEIDGASNNGVENIRELRETVGYMPSSGKYKIYIIDEVHMLSTSAFNALLKTLEEPPSHVMFIFATTEPQKIPVTILSRCQRFDFRRIPVRKVVERLKVIVDAEGVKAEPQALWLLGRESEGSMRDSQSLLDQVITFSGKEITLEKVVDVLGLTDRTLLGDTLTAIVNRNASACLEIIEKVFARGYDPKTFAQDLLEHLRNLMIVKITLSSKFETKASFENQVEFLDLPDQEIDELKKHAENLSEDDVHLLFDMVLKGAGDVVRAQDPRIVLDMLLLRLSQAPRLASIESLLAQMQAGQPVVAKTPVRGGSGGAPGGTGGKPSPMRSSEAEVPAPTPAPVQTQPPVDVQPEIQVIPPNLNDLHGTWQKLIEQFRKERPLLSAKLEYASIQSLDADSMTIAFRKEQEFFFQQVAAPEVVKQIIDITLKYWGKAYKIAVVMNKSESAPLSPRESQEHQQIENDKERRVKVESHPLIQEAKNVFNAKITSIKESSS